MTFTAPTPLLIGILGTFALAGDPSGLPKPTQFAQVTVREQIIIRTMRVRTAPAPNATPVDWKEARSVKCVRAAAIQGAAQLGQRSVDLVLRGGVRVRAQLGSSCPALDYYSGFYITPGEDGLVCRDREFLRSRAGGECEIDNFRELQAVPKRPPPETSTTASAR